MIYCTACLKVHKIYKDTEEIINKDCAKVLKNNKDLIIKETKDKK
jgi:hypothetical protein